MSNSRATTSPDAHQVPEEYSTLDPLSEKKNSSNQNIILQPTQIQSESRVIKPIKPASYSSTQGALE
jgi:FtsZ-interacting cell division protein YlmF